MGNSEPANPASTGLCSDTQCLPGVIESARHSQTIDAQELNLISRPALLFALAGFTLLPMASPASRGQEKDKDAKSAEKEKSTEPAPKEESSVTDHTMKIGGQAIPY